MTDRLKEDTVSADRKERIIFDPDAWRKSDKSGRKTSAITSRQNFDNEKFTRKAEKKEAVDEEIQTTGSSGYDLGTTPSQAKTQPADPIKKKKTDNPQIEFVTGTANPNGSSSTSIGNQQMSGRKISEGFTSNLLKNIREGKAQYKGLEKEDKPGKVKTAAESPHPKGVNIDTVEGWKDQAKPVEESKDTVETDAQGNVKSWKHEGDWQKTNPNKNPEGKVHNLTGQALKKTKELTKKETELEEGNSMKDKKTYTQFVEQLLEYTPGPGGVTRVKGRSYGAQYHDPEGDDDADDKPTAKVDQPKRGRGRPAGSKSGANQKVTTGKSYGGIATHSLNLPNSNR